MRRLFLFYKVLSSKIPKVVYDSVPSIKTPSDTLIHLLFFVPGLSTLKIPFFLVSKSNNLSPKIFNSASYLIFRNTLANFLRPSDNKIFNMDNQVGIQLLNRLRLDFSYLRKHKFRHNFEETINHICSDSIIPEMIMYFFCAVNSTV